MPDSQLCVTAKRAVFLPISIPANTGNPSTLGSLITAALVAAGLAIAAGAEEIAGVKISAKQPGLTTARADFLVGNAATTAALQAASQFVPSGTDWYEIAGNGALNLNVVSNTAAAVPALAIVFIN